MNLKGMEMVTMFLSRLPANTFAPALYHALSPHTSGYKHVYTAPRDRCVTKRNIFYPRSSFEYMS